MSADNGHSEDGGVETREEGAIATSSERLVDLYREMVLIRAFEEACQRGFRQGKIGGYLHVYIGQEAVATGFLEAFQEGDRVVTAYRDHAHALLLGSDPKEVMAELYGRETGLVKGKGGSMHLFDVERGLMGGYGIVGGHIPIGVGIAYAMRYQETDHITQLYLGDGAMSQGRPVPLPVHRREQQVRDGHISRAHHSHDRPGGQVRRLRHREREGGRH